MSGVGDHAPVRSEDLFDCTWLVKGLGKKIDIRNLGATAT